MEMFFSGIFGHRDEDAIAQLLVERPELLNQRDSSGCTVLHWAAHKGYAKLATQLLAQSPGLVNVLTRTNWSALRFAAHGGHDAIAAQLLAHMPDADLHEAARCGHEKVVAQLLAYNPKLIDAVDPYDGSTVLHSAVSSKKTCNKVLARLLACKPELIEAENSSGYTPLHLAFNQHSSAFDFLLVARPEQIYHINSKGNTLLHHAVLGFIEARIKKVWQMYPAAVRVANNHNQTPFHFAAMFNHWQLIELFQGEFSLDEIASVFAEFQCPLERVRPAVDKQCESLLTVLGEDVFCIVYQHLGFERKRNKRKACVELEKIL